MLFIFLRSLGDLFYICNRSLKSVKVINDDRYTRIQKNECMKCLSFTEKAFPILHK